MALWAPALAGPPPQERGRPPTAAVPTPPALFPLKPGLARRAGVTEAPGAPWSPAPMESVDRWPLASPDTQIPGGSRPAGAAVRRRVRGVRTPHPRPVCRRPHSARKGGLVEHPACGPVSEGLQWGQLDGHVFAPPRCAGGLSRWPGARSPLPVYTQVTSWPLSGGSGPPGLGVPTVSVEPAPGVVTKLSG